MSSTVFKICCVLGLDATRSCQMLVLDNSCDMFIEQLFIFEKQTNLPKCMCNKIILEEIYVYRFRFISRWRIKSIFFCSFCYFRNNIVQIWELIAAERIFAVNLKYSKQMSKSLNNLNRYSINFRIPTSPPTFC